VAINTPVLVVLLSTSRSDACVPPANTRRPVPSTSGVRKLRFHEDRRWAEGGL
jgi:hypothetical protein